MSEDEEPGTKSSWGELGHKWITAIAALVTALAAAGFFIGRESAPESSSSTVTAAPATVTVTAPQEVPRAETTASSVIPAGTDEAIYWSGELIWGKFNLDINPPNFTDGESIFGYGDYFTSYGQSKIAAWKKGSRPGKGDCTSSVDADGTHQVRVVKGNQVCGRTAEGRIFLLDVTSVGNTLRTQVTVWNI